MPTARSRYRADLIELAWAIERKYGLPPGAGEAIGSSTNGEEGTFGLVTGGVTLPDPRMEWEPFYGVGVVDRNFHIPIQGREVLEGSIPSIYLTHDNSRLVLEQIMGLIYNSTARASQSGTVTTTATTLNDTSATFETGSYKNNSWTTGTSNLAVVAETNGGGTGGSADETTSHDDSSVSNLAISFNTSNDRLYIGAATPFTLVRFDIGTVNSDAANLTVEYSTISGDYVAGGGFISDGTDSSGVPLAQDGILVLDPPSNWGRTTEGSDADNFYWIRLSFDADITASETPTILDIDLYTSHPTHIVIVGDAVGAALDEWKDTFAFIGPAKGSTVSGGDTDSDGETLLNVYADYGLTRPGWHGKAPPTSGDIRYSVYSIQRGSQPQVTPDAQDGSSNSATVNVRETLVQPSFTLAARFTAEDGQRFTTNYMGNKVTRATFNFEENRPVTYSLDFIAQDMRHDLGAATTVLKYSGDTVNPTFRRVTEQPYFFSRALLQFSGTTFSRFRRLNLTVDNQLDPRYYVTQSGNVDNRQTLFEILEGRRQLSLTGSVDLDDTSNDAQFLRWLLNQGFTDSDVRDMATLQGISLVIELKRIADASGGLFDKITFTFPSGNSTGNPIGTTNTGLVFRTARHPIPSPPDVHHTIDLDILVPSVKVEIDDSTT